MAAVSTRASGMSVDAEPLLEHDHELDEWHSDFDKDSDALDDDADPLQPVPEGDSYARDPFKPFDDLPAERDDILTVRAIVLGLFCGTLVNASNVYLGLRAGWTSSASIFGSIVGFTVLRSCSKYTGSLPFLAGSFGPRENNIVQTAATAAGGMSSVFVSAFPAMYQMNLLSTPAEDYGRILILTAAGGYFGFLFATPLRKFFIIYVARELALIFPSSAATAITIRSMHLAAQGTGEAARKKVQALIYAFGAASFVRIASQYAPGFLWDWHIFTWIFLITRSPFAIGVESWGWFVEWTPAFIGSGMLVGTNVAVSFLLGSFLAWGVVGPYLVAHGLAFGYPVTDDPAWAGYENYFALSQEYTTAVHPSPRYWLMWPGIACMVTVALLDMFCQWKVFYLSGRAVYRAARAYLSSSSSSRRSRPSSDLPYQSVDDEKSSLIQDPAHPSELVPTYIWAPSLVGVLVLVCAVMSAQYGMALRETLLALGLTFFFSFLAIQATGATDLTPLSGASMASQIILGATTRGSEWTIQQSQRMNLLGGALASLGASQAAELTGDFRVGFLLRTSPRQQWYAQGIGTVCAVLIAPAIFVLFTSAYPCIIDATLSAECPFKIPSVSAWRAVAIAVTEPELPVPPSSQVFALVAALVGGSLVLVRQLLWTGRWEGMRAWHPNMMVVGLAFIIPGSQFAVAMVIGALVQRVWQAASRNGFEMYAYAVAAGFMAGEGIGGIVNAVLQILGISGEQIGTHFGCPNLSC